MKRYMITMMVALFAWTGMNAMDYETARERAYYLTDKMAYELNLNDQQYNDAYEINLDYLLSLGSEADIDGAYLTYRNEDLRHILYDWQWAAFAAADYFYRPVWWYRGGWYFPVFNYYTHGYYFYNRPTIFWDYRGGHGRIHFAAGYYHNRRPAWHGGFRGMHNTMVGHPYGRDGRRYGNPGGSMSHRDHNMGHGRPNGISHRSGSTNHRPSTMSNHRNSNHDLRSSHDMRSSSHTTVGGRTHTPSSNHAGSPSGNGMTSHRPNTTTGSHGSLGNSHGSSSPSRNNHSSMRSMNSNHGGSSMGGSRGGSMGGSRGGGSMGGSHGHGGGRSSRR